MKTVKQYIENYIETYIETYTNESLLDDDDIFLDPERDKVIIENWIKENYTVNGVLKINNDFVVSCKGSVVVKNKNITSLTNGMFRWGEVGEFYCCNCGELTSLEGAPKEVDRDFYCSDCGRLESLEGAPEEVGGSFHCAGCKNLKSLEGAPKEVDGGFYCTDCGSLTTLEGAPEWVSKNFDCSDCKNLKSLKGAPKQIYGNLWCSNCKRLELTDSDYKKYNIRS